MSCDPATRTCDRVTGCDEGPPHKLAAREPAHPTIPAPGVNATLPAPTTTPPALRKPTLPSPTPTTTLIAELQGLDVDAVEANLVGVRKAWERGDQSAIAEALIEQASLLETLGTKLLRVAGAEKNPKIIELYGGLALRALEQARKTLATLAGLRDKPRMQTNVQVNVGGPTNEVLGGQHGERVVG